MVHLPAHLEERAADNRFAEIILSPLHKLRHAIISSTADESEVPFLLKCILRLTPANTTCTHPTFALRDERLVVGLAEGLILICLATTTFTRKRGHTAVEGNSAKQCGCDRTVTRKSRSYI